MPAEVTYAGIVGIIVLATANEQPDGATRSNKGRPIAGLCSFKDLLRLSISRKRRRTDLMVFLDQRVRGQYLILMV
jgi:hypothetical protein